MSFLRRIVQRLRSPTYYVGRDLEGNHYYEHPSLVNDPRPRRSVKYRDSGDMWTYVGGHRRLAVQWSAWLTHTRPDPPTVEELEMDLRRQDRLRRNIALLALRDQEEDRLKRAVQTPALSAAASDTPAILPETPLPQPNPKPDNSLPKMASKSNVPEPEAWMPRSARRGAAPQPTAPSEPIDEFPLAPAVETEPWIPQASTRGSPPSQEHPTDSQTPPSSDPISNAAAAEPWTPRTTPRQ
ncbi:hypothetical protein R3P38DRAFT_480894 [Favolaschia claudopus]|uniref:NADH dehydrogenase [ubiquinone] 1 alpha subcomplex subunit n=1 Tax=Favolaschia claudopus TaxID=2862362 RepID=A0AAW0CHN8_9AGAR